MFFRNDRATEIAAARFLRPLKGEGQLNCGRWHIIRYSDGAPICRAKVSMLCSRGKQLNDRAIRTITVTSTASNVPLGQIVDALAFLPQREQMLAHSAAISDT